MRKVFLLLLLILPMAGWSVELAAQDNLTIRVIPRFGLLSPDVYFYEEFANFADDEPVEWTTGSLGRALVAGVGVEVGLENRGLFLRGEVVRSMSGWLLAVHGIVVPRVYYEPPEIVNTWLDLPAALTFASLQLVLPTQFELWGIRPYVMAGGGGKWYHFGSPTEPNTVEAILPSDGFTAALDLGAGVSFTLYGLAFDLQLQDSINRYWGKTQHDLIFSGGLAWRVR